ncbi:aminopeptidase P N-terminal domain-containing protein [Flavobacteriaceae bacterium]|nr:aminopeptidase P N-terminal domain-containing protein [Flavobacteriaceae bacterium]
MKNLIVLVFLLSFFYGHTQKSKLSAEHYQNVRKSFRQKMPDHSVAVLFSAPIRNRANDVDYIYHQDPNFFYLTGWHQPHSVLIIYKDAQTDGSGVYYDKIYVPERNDYMEMWNGKRYDLEEVKELGFDRVAERVDFKSDSQTLDHFDKVMMFEFKNDIRNQKTYIFKDNVRYKVDDPLDLFDLKAAFREAINFPNDFNRLAYKAYQRIMEVDQENHQAVRDEVAYLVKQDSLLLEDEIIKDFLKDPAQDFYKEAKMKTAYALRNINFDTETLSSIMADLREIKTKNEVDLLKKAVAISVVGQIEVMKAMHPEMSEREIQGIHEFVYRKYGAADEGYPSIVGAGENGCVLHYIENDKEDLHNQLVLMDLGAEYYGYTADVTRTIPANGVFSVEQKALYEIVYNSQEAAINASQVGNSFRSIYKLSYDIVAEGLLQLGIIDEASEARKYYPHGLSHHIGLDVHDPGNYGDLKTDMVITIEPGIYIPENSPCDPKWWNIGIRIEDDVLVTSEGPINLSAGAPRDWESIELLMKEESALKDFVLPEINSLIQ